MPFSQSIFLALQKTVFVSAVLLIAVLCIQCRSQLGTFKHLEVDASTLKIRWSEKLLNVQRNGEIFYEVWPNQRNRHFIDELVLPAGSSQQFRYNAFHVDSSNRLITRSKYQELLTGEYGTVYAEITYHYADDYKGDNWATSFTTESYTADVPHEPSQTIDALPSAANLELSAISVVRVFKNGAEFVIASANYAHDGHFESINVSGSRNGEWLGDRFVIPGVEGIGHGEFYSGFKARQAFGLPRVFPKALYLAHPMPICGSAILTSALDVVNLHYNRNRWVRQDLYSDGVIKTKFLEFRFTPEDKALETIDRQRLFGEHSYTRDSNWEKNHSN